MFVLSKEGFKTLKLAWALLALAVFVSTSFVVGSLWFLDRERKENTSSGVQLREAKARVEAARRERENLQESSAVFRTLVARGLLQAEKRLDLVEMLNALRTQNGVFAMDYEVSPQRALVLPGSRSFDSIDILASRVRLKVRTLHEGDLVDFIDGLSNGRQGLYPIDRCVLRRMDIAQPDAIQPRVEADCMMEWITLREKRGNRS
jgi:hypothetical protein